MYKTIVMAYDGSSFSGAALAHASALADLTKAELHILSIASTSGSMAVAESLGGGDIWGQEEQELRERVEVTLKELSDQGLRVVGRVRCGDPADQIIAYAHEVKANLVVLGHVHKGALGRWLHGSVGVKLLDHLPCSLLVAAGNGD